MAGAMTCNMKETKTHQRPGFSALTLHLTLQSAVALQGPLLLQICDKTNGQCMSVSNHASNAHCHPSTSPRDGQLMDATWSVDGRNNEKNCMLIALMHRKRQHMASSLQLHCHKLMFPLAQAMEVVVKVQLHRLAGLS